MTLRNGKRQGPALLSPVVHFELLSGNLAGAVGLLFIVPSILLALRTIRIGAAPVLLPSVWRVAPLRCV